MTEPLSWTTMQFLRDQLKDIGPGNGYHSDFSSFRMLLDRSQIDAANTGYVLVVTTDFAPTREGGGRTNRTMCEDLTVLVEFGVPRDPGLNPELQLHRARADIVRCLKQPLRGKPAGIGEIEYTGATLGDAPDSSNLLIAQVTARAVLTDSLAPAP